MRHIATVLSGITNRLFDRQASGGIRLFSHMPQWPGCGAELDMKLLIELSAAKTFVVEDNIPDGATRASRCKAASQSQTSFHARMLLHQPAWPQAGQNSKSSALVWLIDYEKPANFRVIQAASYGDQDAWATIGDQHFEWGYYQIIEDYQDSPFADPQTLGRSTTNQFLTINKWLTLLSEAQLVCGRIVRVYGPPYPHGHRYVFLDYQVSHPFAVLGMEEVPEEVSSPQGTCRAVIDEKTDLLAKGEFEINAQSPTGEALPPIHLQQVFAGYGHEMQFDPQRPFPPR